MKKVMFVAVLLAVILSAFVFVGCGNSQQIEIYVPDGAPALAVANVIDGGIIGGIKAQVSVSTGEDVVAKCVSGQADIAIVPTNAAAKICSARSDYKLFTANVWGLLYVVGWSDVPSLSGLNGKTVASIGMGNTGEYLFKRILDVNGVSYANTDGVNIKYVDDGTTAIGMLMQNKCQFALLGEPAATNAINKAKAEGKTLYRVFDLQRLWQDLTESGKQGYPQASVIVKTSLLQRDGFAEALYGMLAENKNFLYGNTDRLNGILQATGSVLSVNYTAQIIDGCNIDTVKSCDVKQEIYDYLEQFGKQFAQMLRDDMYYEFGG